MTAPTLAGGPSPATPRALPKGHQVPEWPGGKSTRRRGKGVEGKHIIYFSWGWESRLSYLVTLDALLTQQEGKKKEKGLNKCLELKKAAPGLSGKRGLVFQGVKCSGSG